MISRINASKQKTQGPTIIPANERVLDSTVRVQWMLFVACFYNLNDADNQNTQTKESEHLLPIGEVFRYF